MTPSIARNTHKLESKFNLFDLFRLIIIAYEKKIRVRLCSSLILKMCEFVYLLTGFWYNCQWMEVIEIKSKINRSLKLDISKREKLLLIFPPMLVNFTMLSPQCVFYVYICAWTKNTKMNFISLFESIRPHLKDRIQKKKLHFRIYTYIEIYRFQCHWNGLKVVEAMKLPEVIISLRMKVIATAIKLIETRTGGKLLLIILMKKRQTHKKL